MSVPSGTAAMRRKPAQVSPDRPCVADPGAGFQDWNLALLKSFAITERSGFQFRAEAYDFINHPNLNGPNLNPASGQFGMITSKTGLARNLQLSLRFYF